MSSFLFSRSMIDEFYREYNKGSFEGQRFGQAFHNHFKLEKSTQNKEEFDRLYNMDEASARHFVLEFTNWEC
jgi:hypothetical protein